MSDFIRNITLERHKPISTVPHIGDKVDVHIRIFEGGKERIQVFRGTVLKMGGKGISRSFTVRKISEGIGVEKTFPLASPVLSKVEVVSRSKVRKAKLYYIRKLKGRASRLTSAFFQEDQQSESTSSQAVDEATQVDKKENVKLEKNSDKKSADKSEEKISKIKKTLKSEKASQSEEKSESKKTS